MKQIPLTQNQVAIVDDSDYDELSKYRWFADKQRGGNFYAARKSPMKNGSRFRILMHRQILRLKKGDNREGDHRNHNTLDNCRSNLRACSHSQNMGNRLGSLNKTSKFKGVHFEKDRKKWCASICLNKKMKNLGRFIEEKHAALVYNKAAKKYFGDFAYLNVIV